MTGNNGEGKEPVNTEQVQWLTADEERALVLALFRGAADTGLTDDELERDMEKLVAWFIWVRSGQATVSLLLDGLLSVRIDSSGQPLFGVWEPPTEEVPS